MTLKGLKKHKMLFITMCAIAVVVSVFAIMKSDEVGATLTDGQVCPVCSDDGDANTNGTLTVTTTKQATCTEAGTMTIQCSNTSCKTYSTAVTQTIAITEHTWGEWQSDSEEHWRECTVCGADEDKVAHEIQYEYLPDNGHAKKCKVCGYEGNPEAHTPADEYSTREGGHFRQCTTCLGMAEDLQPHTSEEEATCTTAQTCTTCGYEMQAELGHTAGEEYAIYADTHAKKCTVCGQRAEEPVAHTAGEMYVVMETNSEMHAKKCTVCGGYVNETQGEHIDENSNGECDLCSATITTATCDHSLADTVPWTTVQEPTCTEKGSEEKTCPSCNEIVTREIPATGHTWETGKEVTCTTAGKCTKCGDVPALGHSIATAATCTENSSPCTVCGYAEQALGHRAWENGRCVDCGLECGHDGITWTTTKEPTCGAAGTKEAYCTTCRSNLSLPIAATGNHIWIGGKCKVCKLECKHGEVEWKVTTAATCTESGTENATCKICSLELEQTRITAALGHTPGTAATCTTAQTCTVCNATIVEATGHTIEKATKVDDEKHKGTCTVCGQKDVEEAHVIYHKEGTGTPKGHKEYCKKCDWSSEVKLHSEGDYDVNPKDGVCDFCLQTIEKDSGSGGTTNPSNPNNPSNPDNPHTTHTYGQWVDNGDGTHSRTCTYSGCGNKETQNHTFENGKCTACGAAQTSGDGTTNPDKEHTTHTYGQWVDNGDGTHSRTCTYEGCGNKETQNHTFENGKCTACGATEQVKECEHSYDKVQKDDNYHWVICSKCQQEKANSKSVHTPGQWKDNGNGTHSATCTLSGCGQKLTKAHEYENGICEDCGSIKTETEGCEHKYDTIQKDDESHWVMCSKCKETKANSKAAHTPGKWTDNGDGTHSATCTLSGCGQKLTKAHEYENGTCTDCEAKQPTSGDNSNNNNNNNSNNNNNNNNNNNSNNDNNNNNNNSNNGNNDNNINNNNNNNNNNNTGKDNTVADKEIPKTGKFAIAGIVVTVISLGAIGLTKSIKYKDI